jgi:hypothetical protein
MTINKGFLSRKDELRPRYLFSGFLIWVLCAYIMYAFFQVFRETIRFLTAHLGDEVLLVLSPTENYFYNLFFASIASALGYSIAQRFVLQNSSYIHNASTKSLIRRAITKEGFHTWSFMLWFGKLGSLLGISYWISAFQYELDIISEFPLFLILLPLVLFYSSWPNISRLFKEKKGWLFVSLTCIFLVLSFGFSFKNFLNHEKINNNLLKRSIEQTFDLQIPLSQSFEKKLRRSFTLEIYIVMDTTTSDTPLIFFQQITKNVKISNIPMAVNLEREKLSKYEYGQLQANLHIDARIKMQYIKPILEELRKANLRWIQYSTARKYSRYPSDYPYFKQFGIQRVLFPGYYPEFEEFLDSAEQINLKGKAFKLSESYMYRNAQLKNKHRIEINLSPNSILLNNQQIDLLKLEQTVYRYIKKYTPEYLIILNTQDDVTYKQYIEVLDLLYTQIDRLRNELYYELYQKPYEQQYWHSEPDTIKRLFPRNIIEWSKEEERLNELIKKTKIKD